MNSLRLSGSSLVDDVLGRDDRALDDQDVHARVEDHRRQRERVLRRDPHRDA